MSEVFTNFASSSLAGTITSVQTTLTVKSSEGGLFPALSGSDFYRLVLFKKSTGETEIVKCTARTGDTMTIVRGQEGTTQYSFGVDDIVELRPTKATFDSFYNDYSTDVKNFLGAANNAAAMTSLGISSFGQSLIDDADGSAAQTTLGITAFAKNILDDADAATVRATISAAGLTANNDYTGDNDFQSILKNTSTTAGAAAGPLIAAYRNKTASNNDDVGGFDSAGQNDAGTPEQITYARFAGTIIDKTDGSEDGEAYISVPIAGTYTKILKARQGLYTPNATSGDMGPDTLNISEYYLDGKMVRQGVVLFEETGSSVASFDVLDTDGLVAGYDWYEWEIKCRPASDDEHLRMRTSADGSAGPTWDSTASDYYSTGSCWQGAGIYSWSLTSSATYIGLSYTSAGNEQSNVTTENPLRITVGFRDPSLSNETFGILSDGSGARSTSQEYQRHIGKGERRTNAAVLGLQAYFGTGNVASYTQRLIGYKLT